jgi:MraZ protein
MQAAGVEVFFDSSDHPLDAKFRVFVPKRFTDVLERDPNGTLSVMLTPGEDGCLFLFGVQGFLESLGDLDTRAFTSLAQRNRQRRLAHASTKVTLDASGRLLISERLRKLIDLQPNEEGKVMVKMVGAMNRAEIWPLHRWEEQEAQLEDSGEERHEIVGGEGGRGGSLRELGDRGDGGARGD